MEVNFEWKLSNQESKSILSKLNAIFEVHSVPAADQFIFKSATFSDDQHKSGTRWYLEIVSGKNHYIQLKLCLADIEKLAPLHVTYKLVFNSTMERASCEGKEVLDLKRNCTTIHSKKFINAHYFKTLAVYNYDLNFVCKLQIQVVQGSNNIFGCIQKDYEKLLNDTKYSDFKLVTSTKEFNVHKSILAVRSEVFAAMFEHDMKEMEEGFVEIKEFDDDVVKEFLRYIYCGKVDNLATLAKDLLVAAEKYLIFDLKALCLEEICKSINVENAMELLCLVDNHDVEHLRSNVIDFTVQNIKDSTIKSNLKTMDNVKLSNEILSRTINKYL